MTTTRDRRLTMITVATAVAALTAGLGIAPAAGAPTAVTSSFVRALGDRLVLDGKSFEFSGTNNYYLGYKSDAMLEAVLDDAASAGFDVVRTWGFQDYQNPDGSGSVQQNFEGVWYQAWDAAAGRPVVNEGPDGLQRLDRVVAEAAERGIRLIVPFTNNWNAFGGMDQYVRWADLDEHADFYTDARIRGWYKDWVSTLLNRVNTVTGVAYKDDPTILAWELANEPRCTSAGAYPNGDCDVDTITNWAAEMSAHVKSIDSNHLLSAGDEGFFCRDEDERVMDARYGPSGYGPGFGEDCADGVDTVALAALPDIDLMSLHLYPDHWKVSTEWGTGWIEEHAKAAKRLGKPVYLGEFGLADKATRMPVYHEWLEAVRDSGVDGALYWILSSAQNDGTLYADYDGFTVYCPSAVCSLMSAHDRLIAGAPPGREKPIADLDTAETLDGTPTTVNVLANDVAFRGRMHARTVDLDPSARGVQSSVVIAGGTATHLGDGVVEIVPEPGFTGRLAVPYTVADPVRLAPATLTVTVKPAPGAPRLLHSWEGGTEGWAPANWQTDPGTAAATTEWATEGVGSLRIAANGAGAWFGSPTLSTPVDLSEKTSIEFDVRTGAAGTSIALAVRSGDAWSWCQSGFEYVAPGSVVTRVVELSTMGCDQAGLTQVHDVLLFVNAGVFDVDRLTLR